MTEPTGPIGIFDSGLGGLSVLREIAALLPHEPLLYAADSAYCPYGSRPPEEIGRRSLAVGAALVERGAKLLVVACNTACSVALDDLRAALPVPIIGLEPAVKPAARLTRTGRVAVVATPRTVAGRRLAELIRAHAAGADVLAVPAPTWVELVEAGRIAGPAVEAELRRVVDPLLADGVDTLVLGCTHYPFLREPLARIAGPDVQIVDSGPAIARRASQLLREHRLAADRRTPAAPHLLTTGDRERVGRVASRLLGLSVSVSPLVLA